MNDPTLSSPARRRALSAMCACSGAAASAPLLGGGVLRALLAGAAASSVALPAIAAAVKTTVTPDQALNRLMEGNRLFLQGRLPPVVNNAARRLQIAKSQAPFAILVSCSDSRVPPEALFGVGLGELFIIRVAGNSVSQEGLGSIEYAVAELGVPLVLVMGHERCGAVSAALSVVKDHTIFPGAIGDMVQPILPAAITTRDDPGDWLDNAVRRNVVNVVEKLRISGKLIEAPIADGKLRIVGARYDLDDGEVDFFVS